MTKKDILDWYCEGNAKTFGLCSQGIRNCDCIGKEKLSQMLDEWKNEIVESAPSKRLEGMTGRVIGHNNHCFEIQKWKQQQKEGG